MQEGGFEGLGVAFKTQKYTVCASLREPWLLLKWQKLGSVLCALVTLNALHKLIKLNACQQIVPDISYFMKSAKIKAKHLFSKIYCCVTWL